MMKDHSYFLLSRLLVRLSPDEREKFDDALQIMPQWKMDVTITVLYLCNLSVLVEKLTFEYVTLNSTTTNHAIRNCNYPHLNALAVGAKVIFLCNYVVELCLINGSVGTITHIIYENQEELQEHKPILAYAIVNFPKSEILESEK